MAVSSNKWVLPAGLTIMLIAGCSNKEAKQGVKNWKRKPKMLQNNGDKNEGCR